MWRVVLEWNQTVGLEIQTEHWCPWLLVGVRWIGKEGGVRTWQGEEEEEEKEQEEEEEEVELDDERRLFAD